ncbi:LysR family transcriptional regulator [Pseudaminobacter sp. 19-2017]|uniref:LysR family transcriptional regulator n=1 Tax=Pseudaminobacter soli (ex Zhang et al. 2022) TaxID=2831468 RepID=A0A942E6F1_9HYPH|nr:LysR family transcriptional regulator [Pseudaminobacter soli]MBS3651791.1 LysR family transcriptional regulator [Pseudaminobacter soli]
MDVSLEQLLVFQAAAREKSFSETARKLGKAQSAVSSAIADLEIDLGVSLFDRKGRYPLLTHAGGALLPEVEAILSHRDSLKERAHALASSSEARVAIAIEDAFPTAEIAAVLADMSRSFPSVQLDILQPTGGGLLEMLVNGEATLGLGCARPHYPTGIGFRRLGDVVLINAARYDHPLAGTEGVRFSHLADHVQLFLAAQTGHLLTSEYLKSPRRWVVESQVTLLNLLKSGLGWAIVPRRLVASELQGGEIAELRLDAYPFTDWRVGLDLVWKIDDRPGVVAAWLKTELGRSQISG